MTFTDPLRELQRTVVQLETLNQIAKALTSSLDITEVLEVILTKISELMRPRNWSLLLRDEASGELVFHAALGPGSDTLKGLRLRAGEGIAGWVAAKNESLRVDDVTQDPRFSARFDAASRFQTQSILCVPLATKGRVMGVIELVNGSADGTFCEADLHLLQTIAEFSAIALENAKNFAKVQELTVIDDHTGLYNSRHLKRTLEIEVVRATRFGHPVSLVFFDLDKFKSVNDRLGHQAGSRLLHDVGRLLSKTLRLTDIAVRYGGDEFVAILPETSKDQAVDAAHRLLETFSESLFLEDHPKGPIHVSASFGVATFPDDAKTPEELVLRADQAMYSAKHAGRGRVAGAEPTGVLPDVKET
jgi:diguanylate cyclase (GGDEF)-like protein